MAINKYMIITIDTEADNQWEKTHPSSTNNVKYLPRFQELSEEYGFKPTWLSTYEMVNNDDFVAYFKPKQDNGLCEIGMHLHAWNNPPYYRLEKKTDERSYLIEYPLNIMEEKIKELDSLISDKFGIKAISHRAGRWTTNDKYFELLSKYGYKIDCSVTPNINWNKHLGETGLPGSNYNNYPTQEFLINDKLLEIPMTIRHIRCFEKGKIVSFKKILRELYNYVFGKNQWIRPDSSFSLKGMKKVIDLCNKNNEYIMFMIHSSELMPNGSPNFKDHDEIEKLYNSIEEIFKYISSLGYTGITLKDFYNKIKEKTK